ncbi:MAG: hypothetical protein ABSC19_15185 [Syntrophorhabdales bacterium]|jgi:hypothetical protein
MVPTIFWSAHAEGVLKKNDEHLDPNGCLVQQRGHRIYEDVAKAAEGTRPIEQKKPGLGYGGDFVKKVAEGRVYSLDKDLFTGATSNV